MIRWVNEIFEVQALDSPVRACERRKNRTQWKDSAAEQICQTLGLLV